MASTFTASYHGIGEMLKGHPPLIAGLVKQATRIATIAAATAPRDTGHFADSFHVSVAIRSDRAVAKVTNDDDAALWIEMGTRDTPEHKTLRAAVLASMTGRIR